MAQSATAAAARLAWPAFAPRLLRRRVTLGWELAAVAAWAALVVHVASDPADHHASGPHAMTAAHHAGMWALMSVAMMLPAAIPAIAHVGVNSLRRRRRRAMATFAAVYLGLWLAFGGLVLALAPLWLGLPDGVALAGALALAAAWQLTVYKRRALNACHRSFPLPVSGWRATAGAARFGLRNGGACVGSCWALMLVMTVATEGMLAWTIALAGIVTTEKLVQRPRRPTRFAAALLAGAALATALAAALA